MTSCQNCGKLNSDETNYCRFCGTKFVFEQIRQSANPYDYSAPRPYAWKTDEFQAQTEPRPTVPINQMQPLTERLGQPASTYPALPSQQQSWQPFQPFHCPRCMNQTFARMERRVSTAGWITFAVLIVVFFPLFWIGLLIKEDVRVCQICKSKFSNA